MGNSPEVSLKRRVHILTEAQLLTYQRTKHLDCSEHGHATREEAELKVEWRIVRAINDRIVVLRTWAKPDAT